MIAGSRPGCLGLAFFPTPPRATTKRGGTGSIEHAATRIANGLDLRRGCLRRDGVADAQAPRRGACGQIIAACQQAGFERGGAKAGNGIARSIAFARSCRARRSGAARRNRCRRSLRNWSQRAARPTRTSDSAPGRAQPAAPAQPPVPAASSAGRAIAAAHGTTRSRTDGTAPASSRRAGAYASATKSNAAPAGA